MLKRKGTVRLVTGTLLIVALVAPAASAQAPARAGQNASGEKVQVDESFISQRWTAACGFELHRRNHGHERLWEEPRGGGGILYRGVFAISITLTGVESGESYTFRDAALTASTCLKTAASGSPSSVGPSR